MALVVKSLGKKRGPDWVEEGLGASTELGSAGLVKKNFGRWE